MYALRAAPRLREGSCSPLGLRGRAASDWRRAASQRRARRASCVAPLQLLEDVLALAPRAAQVVEAREGVIEASRRRRSRAARRCPARRAGGAGAERGSGPPRRRGERSRADGEARPRYAGRLSAFAALQGAIGRRRTARRGSRGRARPRATSLRVCVVGAQRRCGVRRVGTAHGGSHEDEECDGGERQIAPTRRVCLPKHEGLTVPQLPSRTVGSGRIE